MYISSSSLTKAHALFFIRHWRRYDSVHHNQVFDLFVHLLSAEIEGGSHHKSHCLARCDTHHSWRESLVKRPHSLELVAVDRSTHLVLNEIPRDMHKPSKPCFAARIRRSLDPGLDCINRGIRHRA